jgi:ATP-dependent DNA helicase RecG
VARRLLADSLQDGDSRAVPEYTLDDLDPESVARFRALLSAGRPSHPFLAKQGADFLRAIGAVALDERGAPHPTWAGMWMLGSEISLRQLLPHWHLSFKELPADPTDTRRWVDRVHPDGTWNANLFEFYMRAVNKITAGLKVPFALNEAQFRVDETEAHKALREALVNALVHADHRGTTGIRVIKGPTGVEFINPGLLLIPPEQLWRGGISEARNPALQRLFGLLQLGEREGSGGPTMRAAWAKQQFRAPKVWTDAEHMETHLRLPTESLLTEQAVSEAMARFGSRFSEQNELGRLIVVTAIVEHEVNHSRVCELSDAHSRDVTLKLQELMRKGLLTSKGHQRQKTYLPAEGDSSTASVDSSEPDFAAKGDSSTAKVDSSTAKVDSSEPYDASSEPYDASSEPYDASSAVTQVRGSKRAPPELVRAAIEQLCHGRYLSLDVLAGWLKRNRNTLRNLHVPRLISEGRLELRYPDSPTHPQQAYRTHKERNS